VIDFLLLLQVLEVQSAATLTPVGYSVAVLVLFFAILESSEMDWCY
jgi:hypothetical protein